MYRLSINFLNQKSKVGYKGACVWYTSAGNSLIQTGKPCHMVNSFPKLPFHRLVFRGFQSLHGIGEVFHLALQPLFTAFRLFQLFPE